MNSKLCKSLFIGAAFSCFLSLSTFAVSNEVDAEYAGSVNLRSNSASASAIITAICKSSPLFVINQQSIGHAGIGCNGTDQLISSDCTNFCEVPDASYSNGTAQRANIAITSNADTDSTNIRYFSGAAKMNAAAMNKIWNKVNYNNTVCFVHSDLMSLAKRNISKPASETKGDKIISTAKKYLGVPYVWAGTSPKGFDCSGFTYYVFKENGYTTNRTADSLYNNGTYVERDELQSGDIICFYNGGYSYIGHVGIYIGDNQFIHASSGDGKVVLESLSTSYYDNHYYGARRIAG